MRLSEKETDEELRKFKVGTPVMRGSIIAIRAVTLDGVGSLSEYGRRTVMVA